MADKIRKWYEKKTTWGVVALFIAGGLEALGATGFAGVLEQVCAVLGLPLTAYGVAERIKK